MTTNTRRTTAAPNQTALPLTTPITHKPVSKADAPDREARMDAARSVLARGLASVAQDPAALRAYLAFRAHFHDYSTNNAVLVWLQRPTARYVMGLKAWATHGRRVRRGERGLVILAPVTRRPSDAEVAAGADPDQPKVVGFRPATVFDYEQTVAQRPDALVFAPPVPRLHADGPAGLTARLEAVAAGLGYTVRRVETGYADGWCRPGAREIAVGAHLSGADRAAVLAHELCHALAHDPAGPLAGEFGSLPAPRRELQAEGGAFVALAALGLDTARASLPYLAHWAREPEALAAELGAVERIARELVRRLDAAAGDAQAGDALADTPSTTTTPA